MKQTLKYILDYVLENLRIAESKHSIITAINGAVIALILNNLSNKVTAIKFLGDAVILFCGLSIIISFIALHARSEKIKFKHKKLENKNLLYYQNLANMTSGDLIQNVIEYYNFPKSYSIDNLDVDLSATIIANSKVVKKKLQLFNYCALLSTLGVLSALMMFILIGGL